MRDGPVRKYLKLIARTMFWVDLRATRRIWRLRGDKPFKLEGGCEGCAKCCESPSIQVGKITWYLPTLRKIFLYWQKHVNGFELKDRIRHQRVFVFDCTHFDHETRRCDSYETRPGMCRDYPRALLWQANPELFEGCGYKIVSQNADRLLAALERENLTEEQMAKLKKGLHLKQDESDDAGSDSTGNRKIS